MGFLENVKKGAKSYAKDFQKSSAERRKYNQDLKEKIQKARREAFSKEAEKQARIRAKLDAQRKFNPTQQQGGGMSAEARSILYGDFGSTKERVEQKITKKKKKKKQVQSFGSTKERVEQKITKKKKKKKQVQRIVQKPVDRVEDVLKRLPQ